MKPYQIRDYLMHVEGVPSYKLVGLSPEELASLVQDVERLKKYISCQTR